MSFMLHIKRFFAGLLILVGWLVLVALALDTVTGTYLVAAVVGVFASYGLGMLIVKEGA